MLLYFENHAMTKAVSFHIFRPLMCIDKALLSEGLQIDVPADMTPCCVYTYVPVFKGHSQLFIYIYI